MNKSRLIIGGVATAAGILAGAFVGDWEGLRRAAYKDVVGVWTACYGETRGIKRGMVFTVEQCKAMLLPRLVEHEQGMRNCIRNPDAIPIKSYVTFVSVTYNIGIGGFCGSSMSRRLNAGDVRGACDALLLWNKAGGRVIRGLVNRRAAERKLCIEGLARAANDNVVWRAAA